MQQFHWQQQPQKDHPEQLRLQRELDHDHGYQQHIEDDFRESYGQITDTGYSLSEQLNRIMYTKNITSKRNYCERTQKFKTIPCKLL